MFCINVNAFQTCGQVVRVLNPGGITTAGADVTCD